MILMMDKQILVKASFAVLLGLSAAIPHALAQVSAQAKQAETAPREVAQLTLDDLRTFTDVFNQLRRNYVEEVDDRELLDAAIRGMLMDLDPHSEYLPRQDYKDLEDNSRGRYSGIGINVQEEDQRIVVKAVINDSPADRSGVNPGDIITAIDGKPVRGRYLPDAIDELMGKPKTEVTLTVMPPGGEEREVRVERKYLQIPTLNFEMLDKSYGYFKIGFFHRESAIHLEQALESIKDDEIILNGLVLDLRDNPGGVLQPAVTMADGFLDEGLIVAIRGRNSAMQMEFNARPGQWLPDIPLFILVDRGTASASEVLAGALQDQGRALIIGERTFGKGSVQSVLPLRNGGGVKLTTARYYTPSGRSIQAEGIEPDVVYRAADAADAPDRRIREADLARHLDRDSQLDTDGPLETADARVDFPLEEVLGVLTDAGKLNGSNGAESQLDADGGR